ncbi:hypothetical protein [Bradyrhizobium sp. Tv2a-2]|uniref:hypothetical protein n=1 Tax=Bradyrhizobium sp. Tv2a-2 TaxID=113395 RepID=UPI000463B9B1|nr:hypothetical protein [Bradyrhizobium sp. Tv2a-2]
MGFLVWLRGNKGPTAQLRLMDPRSSIDWKVMQENVIQIVTLAEHERGYSLDQAVAAHPCPAT